jgi:uncharacterized membrane protein (DUF485 family)
MVTMLASTPTAAQLSEVIGQVAAPAFMLGAVAAFILVLNERLNRVIDRSQTLNAISDDDVTRAHLRADIPRLKRRAALLNTSVFFSVLCAIGTSLLVIVAFVSAYLQVPHEHGVAIIFIISLGLFIVSLVYLALEVRIAIHEFDHHW